MDDATRQIAYGDLTLEAQRRESPEDSGPVHASAGNAESGRAGQAPLDATLVMPRRERPAWRATEPGETARLSKSSERTKGGIAKSSENLKKALSMVAAATSLVAVVSLAWTVLGAEPGDPTFAGAVPPMPAAESSADPAGVAPLTELPGDPIVTSQPGGVAPSVSRAADAPRKRASAQPGVDPAPVRTRTRAKLTVTAEAPATKANAKANAAAAAEEASVSIGSPQNGETVEESVTVSGEADIPAGKQVVLQMRATEGEDYRTVGTCQGARSFVCDPVFLDADEESYQLAVIVADGLASDEVTVHREAG
ncbi:hypothetical protein ACQP2E_15025 [Actinoplanes sp. CA-015351]|uniref:hypothetical protein n=1 Tax=Actinoplanes sp. CA-015351 TaxID=3239897 RepID=UPI003D956920